VRSRTDCVDKPCDAYKSNCCNEIQPKPVLRTDRVDQVCPKYKFNCRNEILLIALLRTGFIDYTCVTRKPYCCKEILQNLVLRTGFIDYTCVTRKSHCCRDMRVIGAVPVIPVSHVSLIAPRTFSRRAILRPAQACALTATSGRRGRRTPLTVKAGVLPSQRRPPRAPKSSEGLSFKLAT
jgi:hypothetical protein